MPTPHDIVLPSLIGAALPLDAQLEIVNMLGQTVYQKPFNREVLQVSGLPTGPLFYRLRQNGELLAVGKLLIAK